jgi:hypothetical protein
MMIVGLKEHFPARISEWFNSLILMSWGAYLLMHPDLFETPGMERIWAGMSEMVWFNSNPESLWGLAAFSVGGARLVALFINGAWGRTPMIRLVTAAASAFVWTQVVIGLTAVPNTGLVVYPWLVVIDLVAAYRAGTDAALAAMRKKVATTGTRRDTTTRSHAAA